MSKKSKAIIFGFFILIVINITGVFHDSTLSESQLKGFIQKHELDPIAVKNGDGRTFILVEEGLYEVSQRTAKYDSSFTPYAWTESAPVMVRTIEGDIAAASIVFDEKLSSQKTTVTVQYSDGSTDSVMTDGDRGAFLMFESDQYSGGAGITAVTVMDEDGTVVYGES